MKILLYMGHCVTKRTSQSFMELGDVLGLKQHVLGLISQKCHLWYHNIPRSFVVIVQSLSCPTLGDPMNCSTPGFPVRHHLMELAQTHLHWVSEAIHLIFCCLLLLLPSVFPSIRVFSNDLALCIRWPKYWNFRISPSNEFQGWFPLGLTGLISLLSKGLLRMFSTTTVWKCQFSGTKPSLWSNSHIHTWLPEKP